MEEVAEPNIIADDEPEDDGGERGDPTELFVTKGEQKGKGWAWKCSC